MKIKPLADNIFVESAGEEKTKSGIVLPETAEKDRPQKGKVVFVGPGRVGEDGKRIPVEVKKGDIVLFKKYAPDEIKVGNKEYLVIKADDILAVLE